ncbi:MAG TPA: hypothetical protein PLQ61_06895 [Bacteroidales bacterium]|nr:hypothetical protein [Petrotogaceae bacterium]HQJ20904.1 hypothetical protein [Bacteroidales bacterium]
MTDISYLSKNLTTKKTESKIFSTDDITLSSLQKTITQSSHGFVVGDVLYLSGSTYTKAIATSAVSAEVVGIVSEVVSPGSFILSLPGSYIAGLSGLTAGTVYFLSDSTAGTISSIEPETEGYVSKPILIADSNTSGYFINTRGTIIYSENSANNENYTSLLLHCESAGSGGVGVLDSSRYNHSVIHYGSTLSTGAYKFGSKSLYFNGSSYIYIPYNPALTYGNGDFSIDFWLNLSSIPPEDYFMIVTQRISASQRMNIYFENRSSQVPKGIRYWHTLNASDVNYTFSYDPESSIAGYSTGVWYHMAFCKLGGTFMIFKNGSLLGSKTINTINYPDFLAPITIGGCPQEGKYMTGYIDELRIIKGYCPYTTDGFTPPTVPYEG